MFTIKFYSESGRSKIMAAESFTILHGSNGAEITLHQKNQDDDRRIDVGCVDPDKPRDPGWPEIYSKAIIENAFGKTTEIISSLPHH